MVTNSAIYLDLIDHVNEVEKHIPCFQRGGKFQIVCFLIFAGIEVFEVVLLIIVKRLLLVLGIDGQETAGGQIIREYCQVSICKMQNSARKRIRVGI